jgi:predicted small lipoprotein YifL
MRTRRPVFALTHAALAAAALTCAALGGCGQTGALYLPSKDSETVSKEPDAAAQTTPAADPAAEAEAARKREQTQPAPK